MKNILENLKSKLNKSKPKVQGNIPFSNSYYQDLINPYYLVFHPSYLETEDYFYDSFLLNDMSGSKKPNYLENIVRYEKETDLSLFFSPTDSSKTLEEYKKITKSLRFKVRKDEEEGKEPDKKMIKMIEDYEEIILDLEEGNESYLNYSILLTNKIKKEKDRKQSYEKFWEERSSLSKLLRTKVQSPSKFYIPRGQIEEAYVSKQPLMEYRLKDWSNISASSGSVLFPFFTETKTPGVEDWIPFWINKNTGEMMFFNHSWLYDRKKITNKNLNVIWGTGSGKTSWLRSQLLLRIAYWDHFIIFDPKRDYTAFSRDMGGQTISFKIDEPIWYNIFSRNTWKYKLTDWTIKEVQSIEEKKIALINIFSIMVPYLSEENSISEFSKTILDSALSKVFEDSPSWEDIDLQLFYDKYLKETILYFIKQESDKINDYTTAWERLKVNFWNFVKKEDWSYGRYYKMFEKVPKDKELKLTDNPIITFDLYDLFKDDLIFTAAVLIWMEFAWNQTTKKKWAWTWKSLYITIDENWKLLKYKMAWEYEERFARLIRWLGWGLYTMSQSLKEYMDNPYGIQLLNQSAISIYLKMEDSELNILKKLFPKRFDEGVIEFFEEISSKGGWHWEGYIYLHWRMTPFKYLYLPVINGRNSWQEKKDWQKNADTMEGYEIK